MTTPNAGHGLTRYLQLYTVLSQALAEGSIRAGDALPSEPTLVRQYGVSRTTVRRALARLAAEGSIFRRRGSGTFARDDVQPNASARQTTAEILDDLQKLAACTTAQLLAFETTSTPDFVQRDWPEFGKSALLIRRVREMNGAPVLLETSYVPHDLGQRLSLASLGNDAVVAALDRLGIQGTSAEQETAAIAADPITARYLEVGIGTPVLNVRRLVRDAHDRIIEYSNSLYRPDRYEIHMTIDRTGAESSGAGHRA